MARLTGFLVMLVVASSLGVVASQHQARKLYAAVERSSSAPSAGGRVGPVAAGTKHLGGPRPYRKTRSRKLAMRPPLPGQIIAIEERAMKKAKKGVTFNHNPLLRSELRLAAAFRPAVPAGRFGGAGGPRGLSAGA